MTVIWHEGRTSRGRVLRAGGEGPDVVLVHGLEDRPETWTPLAERLVHRCRLTALEMPWLVGGHYDWLDAGSAREWLAAMLDELGLTRALLVGHSFGGHAVLRHLSDGGDARGAVLVAPLYRTADELALPDSAELVQSSLVDTVIEGLHLRLGERLHQLEQDHLSLMGSSLSRDVIERAFPALTSCLVARPRIDPTAVRVPLRVVVRQGDPSLSPLAAAQLRRGPDTAVLELEGEGHFLHLIEPDHVAAHVLDLVDRPGSASAAAPPAPAAAASTTTVTTDSTTATIANSTVRGGTIPCPISC